ncbi:spore photoproduct lyase family protein [Deinococcus maricopensis]|uniref:Radical SAM domain-containing protein n=1 Tax=Deinococcus maricopensis (strain DSM 21211 / LMG 22137 / NRRL B-23946 / LB-34) TaxID=709986 RepID=E8U8H0_DEIML|nr:spore photoproduct lyase family protein [Deinococcus maricopensis]ADV67359.1 radical SAM domain-containing protein [Deinococcus maricopensis DSM 21211]
MSSAPLLRPTTIYLEPAVPGYPRGQQILARYPDATRIEVPSHWNIPGLHGNAGLVHDWVRTKRDVLVLGVRKSFTMRANGRSADWIAPGPANGCAMACAYCYVPRRKGYANPITTFVNIEQTLDFLTDHARTLGPKPEANQVDPADWVYDLGENSDLSVDATLSDNVQDLVRLYRDLNGAKMSFATKYVNRDLLQYDPGGGTRIRFSLMPSRVARIVDVRTTPIPERIAAINDFVDAGYEVHLNFSPVILYKGWRDDYAELFTHLNDTLSARARAQLAAEIIFLTHNEQLHDVNLGWHPRAEQLLWQPQLQETKRSEHGGDNVRYRTGFKGRMVREFRELLARHLPDCRVRYAF